MSKSACIICTKETTKGHKVIEDKIIEFIRMVKSKFGIVKGYKLVVCDECIEKYEKKRKDFERKSIFFIGIGVILAIVLLLLNLSIGSLLGGLFLLLIMIIISLMNYVPQIEKEVKKNERKVTKRRTNKK